MFLGCPRFWDVLDVFGVFSGCVRDVFGMSPGCFWDVFGDVFGMLSLGGLGGPGADGGSERAGGRGLSGGLL